MRKSFPVWVIFIISAITVFSRLNSIVKDRGRIQNFQITSLVQYIPFSTESNFNRLFSKDTVKYEFKASQNNLGTIELLINNHEKINSDVLTFRIKEKDSDSWYYSNLYGAEKMDEGKYFPFGFPVIVDSKNKIYLIEIESQKGTIEDSVSLSRDTGGFIARYSFPKTLLLKKIHLIPHFIFSKVKNYVVFFKYEDLVGIFLAFITPFILGIPILLTTPITKKRISTIFSKHKYFILLICAYILTHIPFLSYTQNWDSYWYWKLLIWGIRDFRSATTTVSDIIPAFINNFNFLGHPSMGYAGLTSISQIIDYDNVTLLNIENVILAVLAIWGFYRIVYYFFPNNKFGNILVTGIFGFNPLFYATSISFNLDFGVLVFEVLVIEALIYRKYLWFSIWSIILIFSKEVGILIYFSLISGYLGLFVLKRWWKKKFSLDKKEVLAFLIPLILLGLYFYYTKGNIWSNTAIANTGNKNAFTWNDSGFFSFGLNSGNIEARLFQIFVMNFSWIMTSIILAFWLKAQILGKNLIRLLNVEKIDLIRTVSFVFLIFVVFNTIYIVMPFSRYVVAGTFFITLIFYVSLTSLFEKHPFIPKLILMTYFLLSFIQVFKAIDLSPYLIFGESSLGNNPNSPIFGHHDGLVYNSQFVFVDKLSKMIKDESKDGNPIIFDEGATYFFKDISHRGTVENLAKLKEEGWQNLRYVYLPWFTVREDRLNIISKYYKVVETKKLEYKGYYVELYDLKLI